MIRELTITFDPINEAAFAGERPSVDQTGAIVRFLGIVRGTEGEQEIAGIEYEAFVKMAEHQFKLLFDEVERRWPVQSLRLAHRIGFVAAGEPSLCVEVMAPHRAEAFQACEYLIDQMKQFVPIWKKPHLR